MTILYGINNCDTVKKAIKWLNQQNISYTFYDFKKQPLTQALLTSFTEMNTWDNMLNKRSTTFRNLPEDVKNNLSDSIIFDNVLAQPTLLKRPLLLNNNVLNIGFNVTMYQEIFNHEL